MSEPIVWWVVARKDNGYPLSIYADKDLAEQVAKSNKELLIPVSPIALQKREVKIVPKADVKITPNSASDELPA